MKNLTIHSGILIAALSAAACAGNPPETKGEADPRAAAYEQAAAEANTALDKANYVGFEWRDSRKLLDQADAAAKDGDYDKAMKLANQAKLQGQAASIQAQQQANPKPPF